MGRMPKKVYGFCDSCEEDTLYGNPDLIGSSIVYECESCEEVVWGIALKEVNDIVFE